MVTHPAVRSAISAFARRVILALFFTSFVGASCGQKALGVMPGVVNNPSNLSLRRAVFSFGTSRLCEEMRKRSVAIRMRDEDPVMGRFYPGGCNVQTLANNNLLIQFNGQGFVWTNLTQRIGFEASASVEYDADFLMDGSTMYVYFRQRSTPNATFNPRMVEQQQVGAVAGMSLGSGQSLASTVGGRLIQDVIAKGFTVIREPDGTVEFGLGVIEKGNRPTAPYRLEDGNQVVYNERAEVHQNQRDYVGPIEVPKGAKLRLTIAVEGAPGIDVQLVPKFSGDPWLQTYISQPVPTPPPGLPVLDEAVYSGAIFRRVLPEAGGNYSYYLVLDNTSAAGRTNPTGFARDDRAALVSYAVEIDD